MREIGLKSLCEMDFTDTKSGKGITVRLWPPIFCFEKNLYYCTTEIVGIKENSLAPTYGADPFQALTMSFQRFRVFFEKEAGDFRTSDGDSPHMFFPKEIPWVYGSDVYERLCKIVNDEVQKIEDERTKRRESRTREDET